MIELHNVTKQFAGKRQVTALDDVSLAIPRGEMVSIIGPSGSGKSTLLNLVGGLDRPSSGDVRVDGETLSGLPDVVVPRERRSAAAPARLAAPESRRARARTADARSTGTSHGSPAGRTVRG